MSWQALLQLLIPLIEMLIKLFTGKKTEGRFVRQYLDRCNDAVAKANLTPDLRKRHEKILGRLDALNTKAREKGI